MFTNFGLTAACGQRLLWRPGIIPLWPAQSELRVSCFIDNACANSGAGCAARSRSGVIRFDCDRLDSRPLILRDMPLYRGPLVNQLIEADRWRQVVDTCELSSLNDPHHAQQAHRNSPPQADATPSTAPAQVIDRQREVPVFHLGNMLDVFA